MTEERQSGGRPIRILLVEDTLGDIELTRAALDEAKIANDLYVVGDGDQALEYLRRAGAYAEAPTPDIVLLDLNLPKMNGREVLREIKSDPDLRRIPVIVLTTSVADEDVVRAYDEHANAYIQKPVDFDEFTRVVRTMEEFWLTIVKLPNESRSEGRASA